MGRPSPRTRGVGCDLMHTVKIDLAVCTGCKTCVDACWVDVIRWDDVKGIPFGAYPEDCQICTYCERVCPTGAIEILPDWESRHCPRTFSTERR